MKKKLPNFYIGEEQFLATTPEGLNPIVGNQSEVVALNYFGSPITTIEQGRSLLNELSYLLNVDGECFIWGKTGDALGTTLSNQFISEPKKLDTKGVLVKAMAIGNEHALFLSQDGKLYGSGSNDSGQLGLPTDGVYDFIALNLPEPDEKVKEIAVGFDSSYVVTESGQLYVCGANEFGELGTGGIIPVNEYQFTKIPFNQPIKKVVPTGSNTYLITEAGHVFSCGQNEQGVLGHFVAKDYETKFKQVLLPNYIKITQLIGCSDVVLALTDEGQLYGWGHSRIKKFGKEYMILTDICFPMRLYENQHIIAMYGHFNNGTLLLVTNTNKVLSLKNEGGSFENFIKQKLGELYETFCNAPLKASSIKAYKDVTFLFAANSISLPASGGGKNVLIQEKASSLSL